MPDEREPSGSETLRYERPSRDGSRAGLQTRNLKQLAFWFSICIILVALAGLGIPGALAVGAILSPIGFYFWLRRRPKGKLRSEEEDEKLWAERREEKDEMLCIAKEVYALIPLGSWRMKDIYYRRRGDPTVNEERLIQIRSDGTGLYRWFKRGDRPITLESTFEHKPSDIPNVFLVRMVLPRAVDWRPVKFGFEVLRDSETEMKLMLWLDSDNPMPLESLEYWPFTGDFVRELQ